MPRPYLIRPRFQQGLDAGEPLRAFPDLPISNPILWLSPANVYIYFHITVQRSPTLV